MCRCRIHQFCPPFCSVGAVPDYDYGLISFADSITSGEVQGQTALLYGYGLYLMGGGTPSDFMDLTESDIQILIQTRESLAIRERNAILKGLVEIFTGKEMV